MKNGVNVVIGNVLFFGVFALIILVFLELGLRVFMSLDDRAASAVGIPIYQLDEINTYGHKPGSSARNGYGDPTPKIEINDLGMRDEDFDDSVHLKNILMLGDSFTFGTGVGQSETFSEILQKELGGDIQVWNAGHIGQSIGNYYLWLKKYADLMPLDGVVVNIFVSNDITELRRKNWMFEGNDLVKVEDQKVFANQDNKLESWESRKPRFYSLWWLEKRWNILAYKMDWKDPRHEKPTLTWPVFLSEDHPAWDPNLPGYWERFLDMMLSLEQFAKEREIPVVFSLIPMDVQVSVSYDDKYAIFYFDEDARTADRPQTKIKSWCETHQLICVDPLKTFRDHQLKDKLYFSHNADPHFDRLGHRVYGEFLRDRLKEVVSW